MAVSSVNVKILYKTVCVLEEKSVPLDGKDLKDLITVLRDTQQRTNDYLTKLTEETSKLSASEKLEQSDVSEGYSTDDEAPEDSDLTRTVDDDVNDVSPKRAKLKKNL